MSRRFLPALALVPLLTGPALADVTPPEFRDGFEFLGSIGLNACVADGTATCDNLATMVQFSVAPGYRFIPQVGLYLDAGLGTLTVEEGDEFPGDTDLATIVWLMPTIRGIYPMEPVDIHAGLGFGYSRRSISGTITNPFNGNTTDVSTTRTNFSDARLSAGVTFYLTETFAIGVDLAVLFQSNRSGEFCAEVDGDEDCNAITSGEVEDLLQLGAIARVLL